MESDEAGAGQLLMHGEYKGQDKILQDKVGS